MRRIKITADQMAELVDLARFGRGAAWRSGGLSAGDLALEVRRRFELDASEATVRRWLRAAGLRHHGDRWRLPG